MDKYVFSVIQAWAHARQDADKNPQMMIYSSSRKVLDECARRMKVLQACEDDLAAMMSRQDLPRQLIRYFRAQEDRGCAACWYTSSMPDHPDCMAKIDEYFAARQELYHLGMSNLTE